MPDSARDRLSSLQALLIVPFLFQICLTVGVVGFLSFWNGQRAVKNVANTLSREISDRVQERIQLYLKTPHFVNQLNADAIESGQLNLKETRVVERYFCQQLTAFQSTSQNSNSEANGLNQSVNNIYFGNPKGELFGAERTETGQFKILRADASTDSSLDRFITRNCKVITQKILKKKGREKYNATSRPWYQEATEKGKPTWSSVYKDATTQKLVIGAAQPLYETGQEANTEVLIGVLGSDLLLDEVGDFLENIKVGNSIIFILNEKDELIVDSTGEKVIAEAKNNKKNDLTRIVTRQLSQALEKKPRKIEFTEQKDNSIEFIKAKHSKKKTIKELALCLEKESIKNQDNKLGKELLSCSTKNENYWLKETDLEDKYGLNWQTIVVAIPESDFMAEINRNNRTTIGLWAIALGFAIVTGWFAAKRIAQPVETLKASANQLSDVLTELEESKLFYQVCLLSYAARSRSSSLINYWLSRYQLEAEELEADSDRFQNTIREVEAIEHPNELKYLAIQFSGMAKNLRQSFTNLEDINQRLTKTKNAYAHFVPRRFLELLDTEIIDISLGEYENLTMSILFSDIRDFTRLSEQMETRDNFEFINKYLRIMEPAIAKNNGFIDKYIGDAIMALFEKEADDAVQAGIQMLSQGLVEFNRDRGQREDREEIKIGVGIHTGRLMLGTVGSERRMDVTVIGDAVNLASRLEGLTKHYGVQLLISRDTQAALQQQYEQRCLGKVKVKGREKAIEIFEIYNSDPPESIQRKNETKSNFEKALTLYRRESIDLAQVEFEDILRRNPQDKAAAFYLKRCRYYQQFRMPEKWKEGRWDGVELFDEK